MYTKLCFIVRLVFAFSVESGPNWACWEAHHVETYFVEGNSDLLSSLVQHCFNWQRHHLNLVQFLKAVIDQFVL